MTRLFRKIIPLALVCALFFGATYLYAGHKGPADPSDKLFINLTSGALTDLDGDVINRARMAIMYATMMQSDIQTTIFLNVEGVWLAHADSQLLWMHKEELGTVSEWLANFRELGGEIIICPGCIRNVTGLDPTGSDPEVEDFPFAVDGIVLGNPGIVSEALFAKHANVRVMSY